MRKEQSILFRPIPIKIRRRLLLELRIENSKRIYIMSIIGFCFFFLFCVLDYLRFEAGKIQLYNIYFFLFLNHLVFFFFLFPIITIRRNRRAFNQGKFKYGSFFIYTWTLFLGAVLLPMAVLSVAERGSYSMYFLYIIVANFGLIMLHLDRIFLNTFSYCVIILTILFMYYIMTMNFW